MTLANYFLVLYNMCLTRQGAGPAFRTGSWDPLVVGRVSGVHGDRLTSVRGPRVRTDFVRTGGLITRLQVVDACSSNFERILRRLIPNVPSASIVYPPFCYSRKRNVHLKRRIFIGTGYAFLSNKCVAVKTRALVKPGMRVCAPRRPMSCVAQHRPGRCTCPMAVKRSY